MAKLYDAYGREVDTGRLKEEQAAATVTGVRNIYSIEHPAAAITPERLTSILRLAEFGDPYLYLEFCEDIEERDLHYLVVLSSRKESVAQLDPVIKPATESAADQKVAEFVREAILESELELDLVAMLDALGKGFSVSEIIWDQSGSAWTPSQVKWRDPRWFMFDWISGDEILVRSLRTDGQKVIPESRIAAAPEAGSEVKIGIQPATQPLAPFKFVTHVAKAKAGLPIRGGLARAAAWAYLFKIYVLKDWVTFAEVYGQPLRVGKYGPGATEADKNALLRAVSNIGTDAAAIIPDSMLIEFAETAGQTRASADLYEKFCDYLDNSLSKAVLGQTLTTQLPRGGGSRAAAQVHEAVRRDILASDARKLSITLTRDLVRPLVDLNFGPQKRYPKFWLGLPDDSDVKVFVDAVTAMVDHGLRVGQRTVLDKLGLPEPSAGEECLTPAGKASSSGDDDDNDPEAISDETASSKKKALMRRRWSGY